LRIEGCGGGGKATAGALARVVALFKNGLRCSGLLSKKVQTSPKPQFSVEEKSRFNSPTIAG